MISFKKLSDIANSTISKIFGEKMKLGIFVAKEQDLPPITPTKIQISKPRIVFGEEKVNYMPYIVIGGGILVLVLLMR